MSLEQTLTPDSIMLDIKASCKREVLAALANKASEMIGGDSDAILDALIERERLGSTGVGEGVAIPHGKIEGLSKIFGIFARLERPIDFDALDNQPVDLYFLLLAPANATAAHLKTLAKVARLLRDQDIRDALRDAETTETAWAIATSDRKSDAA